MPRLSVGLPIYNGDNYGEAAIKSILAQTYLDFELIIADNGVGFNRENQEDWSGEGSGLGFRSMRERVAATGGLLEIESGHDQGTTIRAIWSEPALKSLAE
jgi:signal transduction histidine kinase